MPAEPDREGHDLPRREHALVAGPDAKRGTPRQHDQQLLVGVVKVQGRDHRALLELVEIRRQSLRAGMLSQTDGAQQRAPGDDLGVPDWLE